MLQYKPPSVGFSRGWKVLTQQKNHKHFLRPKAEVGEKEEEKTFYIR
jgi:hypothetical protein